MYRDGRRYGIAVRIPDINQRFRETKTKFIVNGFNLSDEASRQRLDELLSMHCEGDVLSVIPSCDCGESSGEPLRGMICPSCQTEVVAITEKSLAPVAWMKPPEGVHAFINPQVWTILSKAMTINGFNILEYLCNPLMSPPDKPTRPIQKLLTENIPRGINYFHDNFDAVMEKMFSMGLVYHSGSRRSRIDLSKFIAKYRDRIFVEALPIPTKMSFVTEKTVTSTYADKSIALARDAVNTITTTVNSPRPLSLRTLQGRSVKANAMMAHYHQENISQTLGKKPGAWRRNVIAGRFHFTFRAVISSLSDSHRYDELHLPWSLAVSVFDIHLTAKLRQLGYSDAHAASHLAAHTNKHCDLIQELFEQLIDESPGPGFPVLLNRNPTLMRGSIQRMWVTKIKSDPDITSISMSVLALKAPNADYDGRALPSLNLSNCWKLSKAA